MRPIDDDLSPAAELLRSTLVDAPNRDQEAFVAWRRKRSLGRAGAWMAAIALMAPGLICLFVDVPLELSALIEAAGLGAGWWLRRLRRDHLAAVRTWEPGDD